MAQPDIPWTGLEALSFDIYGTLIDWKNGLIDAALSTGLQSYLASDREVVYEELRKRDRMVEREMPHLKKSDVNAEAFSRYAADLGLVRDGKVGQDDVDRAARSYGNALGSFPAFADTVDAIQQLAKHYKLVPLSNIDHDSFEKTLTGPLKDCSFAASYIAEDIGSYKPDRRNFEYLLEHLRSDFGIEQGELCHVAQSLYHDHATTKTMGIRSVWVDRYSVLQQGQDDEPALQVEYGFKLRVETLGELADTVDAAFAGKPT